MSSWQHELISNECPHATPRHDTTRHDDTTRKEAHCVEVDKLEDELLVNVAAHANNLSPSIEIRVGLSSIELDDAHTTRPGQGHEITVGQLRKSDDLNKCYISSGLQPFAQNERASHGAANDLALVVALLVESRRWKANETETPLTQIHHFQEVLAPSHRDGGGDLSCVLEDHL